MNDKISTAISWLFETAVNPVNVILAATVLLICGLIYKLTRPKYPVRVSCWFCMSETVVPYGNQNCWDCPQCEQYNGFTKDGDYNKPIPAQHVEDLNYPIRCKPDVYLGCQSTLCSQCEQNQLLKIKQLAAFTPICEDRFEREITEYERHLEREYALCAECRQKVDRELRKQDDILRVGLQGTRFDTSAVSDSTDFNNSQFEETGADKHCCVSAVGPVVMFLAWLIACALFVCENISTISHGMRRMLSFVPNSWSLVLGSRFVVGLLEGVMAGYQPMIITAGLVLSFTAKVFHGRERLSALDIMDCLTWMASAVGSMYPGWIGKNIMSVIITANFITSLVNILYTKGKTKSFKGFTRVSLDHSETTQVTETDMTPVTSDSVTTSQPSLSTSRHIEADDLDLEFNAMSVDPNGVHLKRNDSGIFSSTASLSSLASTAKTTTDGKPRPIITPAKLRFVSFRQTAVFGQNKSNEHREQQKSTTKSVLSASQENLFQLSLQSKENLHLFDKQYMQAVPALKPSPFDSTNFPLRMTDGINPNSLFTGGLFSQKVTTGGQDSCGQFSQHPTGSLFSQGVAANSQKSSQLPYTTADVFSRGLATDSQEMPGRFSSHDVNRSRYSPNGILRKPRLFDSSLKTTSSLNSSWSPAVSKSHFPGKLQENLNFEKFGVRRKAYYANAYANNPFSSVGSSRTSVGSKKCKADSRAGRSERWPYGYDSISTLRDSLLSDEMSKLSDSSQCEVDSTDEIKQTSRKGFSWTSIITVVVVCVSVLANTGLAVYMYFFSAT